MTLEQYKNQLENWKKARELATQGEWNFEPERYSVKCVIGLKPLDDRWVANYQPEFNGELNAIFSCFAANNWTALIKNHIAAIEQLEKVSKAKCYPECAHPQSVWYEEHVINPTRKTLNKITGEK